MHFTAAVEKVLLPMELENKFAINIIISSIIIVNNCIAYFVVKKKTEATDRQLVGWEQGGDEQRQKIERNRLSRND